MAALGYALGPLLVLVATWLLLLSVDGERVDRRKAVRLGIGLLVAALLATGGAMAVDEPGHTPGIFEPTPPA